MLEASYGLELSEGVLTEQRNPDESNEETTSGSSNNASSSGVSIESMRMESRPHSKSSTTWSRKE